MNIKPDNSGKKAALYSALTGVAGLRNGQMPMATNLRTLDLNLLTVFEAVFETGSITRAADRLALSQSAQELVAQTVNAAVSADVSRA